MSNAPLLRGWVERTMHRPVYVAGRSWFKVPVPILECQLHFSELPTDPNATELPSLAGTHAAALLIRSQPVTAALPRFARHGDWLRYAPNHYERALIEKRGSWDDYLKKFDGKERNNLRRKMRRYVEAAGDACFRVFTGPEDVVEFHEAALAIAAQTYQARLFGNTISDSPQFRADLIERAKTNRQLGALLYFEGKPIAFWWFTRTGSTLVAEYTGYDAAYKQQTPGTVLLLLMLEHFFQNPAYQRFDFGEGEIFYKQHYATATQLCAEVFYLRPSVRTLELLIADHAALGARLALAPIDRELERRGWRAKIKRFMRGQQAD